MKNQKLLWTIPIIFLAGLYIFGQDSNSVSNSGINNSMPEPEETSDTIIPLSRLEYSLSIIVLAFGLVVILLEVFIIKSKKINTDNTIKLLLITLIITSTLFLITAGYSNDQIAPAVGLLGTIAGYLLGKIQNSKNIDDE
ncbi:MAG: hypothetical protein A2V93_00905 [Ignavibacteria bacterium RBG_16_34_14]|nr:MAG: hypothetical protein A2V93_00905 [Ignavibacteria bacterium RBG_16_34_14]